MAIINSICAKLNFKRETTNPEEMKIKYNLVLHGMIWAEENNIENNTIGVFQTRNSNTPGYYIVQWTGNAYNLQKKYTCHEFYPPVIITEGELVFPANFITPMRKIPIGITIQMKQSLP